MNLFNIIYLVYGIPCSILYIIIIGTVISMRKEFSSSFTTIFLVMAVVNLTTYVNAWLAIRLMSEPFFFWYYEWIMMPELQFVRYAQQFCVSYFYFAQNACALLFTVNRFTAICLPSPHVKFWSVWKWPFVLLVHGIAVAIPLATRLPAMVKYEYNPITNTYAMIREGMNKVLIAMISFGSVVLIMCITANVYSAYRLFKFRSKSKHSGKNASKNSSKFSSKSELSFTLISFCIFFAQVMNVSIIIFSTICTFTGNTKVVQFLSTITPFTSDIFSLGPAVYTLIVPGPIKTRVVHLIRRRILHLPSTHTGSQASVIPR